MLATARRTRLYVAGGAGRGGLLVTASFAMAHGDVCVNSKGRG